MKKIISLIILILLIALAGCFVNDPGYDNSGLNMGYAYIFPNNLSISRDKDNFQISSQVGIFLPNSEVDSAWIYGIDFNWSEELYHTNEAPHTQGHIVWRSNESLLSISELAPYNVYHIQMKAIKNGQIVGELQAPIQLFINP